MVTIPDTPTAQEYQMSLIHNPATVAEFWRLRLWQPEAIVTVASVDTRLPSWDTDEHETVHTAYGYTDALGADRVWFRWETCDSECSTDLVCFDNALDAGAAWRVRVTQYLLGCRVVEAALADGTPAFYGDEKTYRFYADVMRDAQILLYAALTGLPHNEAGAEVARTTKDRPKDSMATDGVEPITDFDAGWGHSHAYHHLLTLGQD